MVKKPLPPSNNIRIKIHFIFQDVTVWFSKNFNRIRIFECEIRIRNTLVCTKMMDYRPNVGHALLVPVHIFFGSEFDPDSPGSTDQRIRVCLRCMFGYLLACVSAQPISGTGQSQSGSRSHLFGSEFDPDLLFYTRFNGSTDPGLFQGYVRDPGIYLRTSPDPDPLLPYLHWTSLIMSSIHSFTFYTRMKSINPLY